MLNPSELHHRAAILGYDRPVHGLKRRGIKLWGVTSLASESLGVSFNVRQ